MKNILVIGGSYFAGRVFVEKLLKESDYSIYVLNRGNHPLNMEGVKEIVSDRNDVERMEQVLPSLDWHTVVDFCAYNATDIENTFYVLPQYSVDQYIYISTTSIYRDTLDLPVKEDSPKLIGPQPELGPASDYAFDKLRAELELIEQCKERGVRYTSMRPAIIYGKYNYAPRESYFFDLINQNQIIAIPDNNLALFQFVSVWDVARILIMSLGNEKVFDQAFNLSAGELISYGRLIEVLREITQKRIATKTMSISAIDQERIPLPFPLDQHLIYSGTLIQEVLGFEYTPFVEGMKKTYEQYVENSK
ncbi:MAG: NAD-dependent epimerase/dehydratase family protein [Thermodesulfobacteriota bacterium]|nr:NAD-dependent epimerase/dehydratase family protein [Thermodesulfobacteriota bacterium]